MKRIVVVAAGIAALLLSPTAARAADPAPGPAVVVEPDTLTVAEGHGATFTIRLSAPPTSYVAIQTGLTGTGRWAMPPILLMFGPSDWDRPKSLTIYSATDPDAVNDVLAVTLSAPGYLPDTVTLTQQDNSAA